MLWGLCPEAKPAGAAEIRVTGSDLFGDGFARAVSDYARRNGTAVRLDLHGTRPGLAGLQAGRADLGLFLLPVDELPPGDLLVSRVIGYQVAVVVVPQISPLRDITLAGLRDIFAFSPGNAPSRWGELNLAGDWATRPIALHALAPAAGLAFPLFQRIILAGGETRPTVEFFATPELFTQRLLATDNAIGVTGAAADGVAGLRVLPLATRPVAPAFAPTPENVHQGDYPLRLPLHVVFPRQAAPALRLFLEFLLSDEAAAALASAHFVPLPPGARSQLVSELEEMR